jgi:hypothetical protein
MPLRLAWLFGLALMAPIALPAGGAERDQPGLRRRRTGEPLLATAPQKLQISPHHQAPLLGAVADAGMPYEILQTWFSSEGERWCRVRQGSLRGWLLG